MIAAAAALTSGFIAVNASRAMQLERDLLQRADLVIVNEHEYALLPGIAETRLVAVTYGGKGGRLFARGKLIATAASPRVQVRNTVGAGAGDEFAAALTVGVMRSHKPELALRRACAVGAAAVQDERSQPLLRVLDDY